MTVETNYVTRGEGQASSMAARAFLNVRLLGELRFLRSGQPAFALPASRKTRALLGYLLATGESHRRERLEQEVGRYDRVRARCVELQSVAARLGEDETPFASALHALSLVSAEDPTVQDALAGALQQLRTVDDKAYLACALNWAAKLHLAIGHRDEAKHYAEEALRAARAVGRNNEAIIAQILLARAVGRSHLEPENEPMAGQDWSKVSARARSTWQEARS